MATTISLNVWLGYLILREKRKQDDSYKRDEDVDKTNNFLKKNKGTQLEYIEIAVSVALLVVQTLIVSTSSIAGQQITIDNFTVVIDDVPNLEENTDDESLQRIIESVSQLKFTLHLIALRMPRENSKNQMMFCREKLVQFCTYFFAEELIRPQY